MPDTESAYPVSFYPVELKRDADALTIVWSDDQTQRLPIRDLQQECPCATCRERRKGLEEQSARYPLQIISTNDPTAVTIEKMEPVGNYAYSIRYSSGCNKGIYSFGFLRGLGGLTS